MKTIQQFISNLFIGSAITFTFATQAFAQTWSPAGLPNEIWNAVSSSADGTKLAAVGIGGIYVSTNSGSTWIPANVPLNGVPFIDWAAVASSADGTKLVVVGQYDSDSGWRIYTSTNSGLNWAASTSLGLHWTSVASSADGAKLVAGTDGSYIYTSTDSGVTWTTNSTLQGHWSSVASSADGTKLIASLYEIPGDSYGAIYTSTNSGSSWTQLTNLPPQELWTSVSSSADGTKLAAVEYFTIYTSKDSGTTWTAPTSVNYNGTIVQPILWDSSVASSADGIKLVAGGDSGWIYTSTNSGTTWTLSFSTNAAAVASSADGNKLVAAVEDGLVYTSYSIPTPCLDIAPSSTNLVLSWVIPSTNFVMQQSSDLTSWSNVTNPPVLNLTNLENEVILSPSNSSDFYRLKTP